MEFKQSVDVSHMSDEVIRENELPLFLITLENQALTCIQNRDLSTALGILKRIEEVMEAISTQGGVVSSEMIVSTLHNITYCYQE